MPATRGSRGRALGSAAGVELAAVARQLGLEPADLAPQLAPRGTLVGLEPGVVELELGGQLAEVELGRLRLALGREPGVERLGQRGRRPGW